MQPKWRRSKIVNSLPLPLSTAKPNDNVSALRKCGPSGLVIVITSLAWWASVRATDARWDAAVVDLHACIDSYMLGGKKCKDLNGGGESSEGKRQRR